jgi:CTP:molybdopterin cytidylyltransferase MocA
MIFLNQTGVNEMSGTIFSALILSSGLSERMGTPKALLKWNSSTTFIEKLIHEYLDTGCLKVVCTVNPLLYPFATDLKLPENVKFVLNEHPDWGRMYSVKLGLLKLQGSDFIFLQNVDNPFIDAKIIRRIKDTADSEAWCSPTFQGRGGHPVLLPDALIKAILDDYSPDSTLQQLLKRHPRREVPLDTDAITRNINTPGDYQDFLKLKS